MRRLLASVLTILAAGAVLVLTSGATSDTTPAGRYRVEVDNAFGLVSGADFKVAGVRAGAIKGIDLCETVAHSGCRNPLHALVTVSVTQKGFSSFRSDVFCQTRPQSLIGEYFLECDPGRSGQLLPAGSTIPIERTQTTIAPDLLTDIMRLPYRQRFSLIIGELGAGVAGRGQDLNAALHRAVPAITQTDNLLRLLANDSTTLQNLTAASDQVITALANNSGQVQRFIHEAGHTAQLSAARNVALQATFHKLPGFLEQLKPALSDLGAATDANTPALQNLGASAPQLTRLLRDLVPFDASSRPALRSLGQASITGRSAVLAARPTIAHLNTFAKATPELAQNLGIVLPELDHRQPAAAGTDKLVGGGATEKDPRSPGGQGYTGLEALLQYVFNQALAINTFGPIGHVLAVDAFADTKCSQYATPQSIANGLKSYGPAYRSCYAWLGPNQPGINEADPSNPGGAVPDPGGAPPGHTGPATNAPKLQADSAGPRIRTALRTQAGKPSAAVRAASPPASSPSGGGSTATPGPAAAAPATKANPVSATGAGAVKSVSQAIGAVLGGITTSGAGGGGTGLGGLPGAGSTSPGQGGAAQDSHSRSAQQLLNYLLAP